MSRDNGGPLPTLITSYNLFELTTTTSTHIEQIPLSQYEEERLRCCGLIYPAGDNFLVDLDRLVGKEGRVASCHLIHQHP